MQPRIAVSGVGIVSALGHSAAETFRALMAGERGIGSLTLFDAGDVRAQRVAEVRGLRVSDVAPAGRAQELSRTDALAIVAAREAVLAAQLPAGARLGVALGGTTGGMFETEDVLSRPELEQLAPYRAERLTSYPLSASTARVAEAIGGVRARRSICSACSGGAIALVQAAAWLIQGEVDHVLAGGADGLCRLTVLGFNALGAADPELCRPFDRSRAGLNLGEAGAVLVLEREETALARGANVLAWLDGYAVGAEAHHITHPEPTGARATELMRSAMSRAGLAPRDIGYVNAHGTGTRQNDAMEAQALLNVLGPTAPAWVSSSKAQLGHTLGAAGAIEAALTVLALSRGEVPPTAGLVDPEIPGLRHVIGRGRAARLESALSSSFGFGGMSCVLAFSASQRERPPSERPPTRLAIVSGVVFDAQAEPEKSLDAERSRRFDEASALAAVGARSLLESGSGETGSVLGTAFGNVSRTMEFLARGRERGARLVPPAEFPHLVPSAPAGNASVYAAMTGPVFAVSDVEQSGEAAFETACQLIEQGVTGSLVAGAMAPRDAIVERVLGPLLDPSDFRSQPRGRGAGFVLLAEFSNARVAGKASVEVLGRFKAELGAGEGLDAVPALARTERALVVLGAASARLREALGRSSWRDAESVDLAAEHGYHEALGAMAIAKAAQRLTTGEHESALALSGSGNEYCAVLLRRVSPRE